MRWATGEYTATALIGLQECFSVASRIVCCRNERRNGAAIGWLWRPWSPRIAWWDATSGWVTGVGTTTALFGLQARCYVAYLAGCCRIAADRSSASAAASSCSTRAMPQQQTTAALVQQPQQRHMSEAADSGIGAVADRSNASAAASSCSTRAMAQQQAAAALVCSNLGCIRPMSPHLTRVRPCAAG